MASSTGEVMEIDSDDEAPSCPAKKMKSVEKSDDEKAMEIILILEDSEDEKIDEKNKENSKKEEEKVKEKEKTTSVTDSKAVKGEPIIQPGIIDINDDDDEDSNDVREVPTSKNADSTISKGGNVKEVSRPENADSTIRQSGDDEDDDDCTLVKEIFTPKDAESTKREGVIIKDVEEITQNRSADANADKKVIELEEEEEEEEADKKNDSEDEITVEELDPETQANRLKCLNSGCQSGANLEICNESFVFTFYGMKPRAKKLVCKACFKAADNHFEQLVTLLKENKPLFTASCPPCSDIVLLEDSDEENEEEFEGEDVELSDEAMNIVQNNDLLEKFVKETMEKYGFDEQLKENKRLLEIEAESLEAEMKELDGRFESCFTVMQQCQDVIYRDFQPRFRSLSPVEIIDVHEEQVPLHSSRQSGRGLSSAARMPANTHNSSQASTVAGRPVAVAMKKVTQYASNSAQWRQSFGLAASAASQASAASYRPPTVTNEQDVVALDSTPSTLPPLPPFGVLQRPELKKGDSVFVMRQSLFTAWGLAEVLEVMPKKDDSSDTQVRVLYDLNKRTPPAKIVTAKLVAYSHVSRVRLSVGSRIIAVYRGDDDVITEPGNFYYYSGIVAESPKIINKFRYLVFFDDGYTQYVTRNNIRLVCESSKNVWEDVHPESQQFIKDYLARYPERPMVKLNLDEIVKTEWNGKWWVGRVKEIDASLVKMYFDVDDRTEWIYRGSTRLAPLYVEMMAARDRQSGKSRHASILKRQNPYVEYTQNVDESNSDDDDDDVELVEASEDQSQPSRSVARKSTNRIQKQNKSEVVHHKVGPVDISVKPKHYVQQDHPGTIVKVSLANALKPRQYQPHKCSSSCVAWTKYTFQQSKEIPGLLRPLKFGFQRLLYTKKSKPFVVYIGPCGRRLRSHKETFRYLFKTHSQLSCDYFDFDPWVSCVNEFKLLKINTSIKDLSYGKENLSIECVNYVDHTYPDFVYYQTERRAMENVNLNTEPEFLSGCNCTDNCQDRSKCSCWQLTVNGARSVPGMDFDEATLGYQYRRLPEPVVSGIYECNSQCKCSSTCLNRVVQFPISVKLQLYKTLMKGWGIRVLHDIPQGSFICIYAGNLLTEQAANEGGKTYGDEYLAELDFIEVIENLKNDYESDVPDSSDEESEASNRNRGRRINESEDEEEEDVDDPKEVDDERRKGGYEMDRTFSVSNSRINSDAASNMRDRLRAREKSKNKSRESRDTDSGDSDDRTEKSRKPVQFNANIKENDKRRHRSVREYYDDDGCIYIMDAKNGGNIGRYMNHSCNPNVFVQNVFVDTHDLRFPWVAFFASCFIEAGKELTWDYNYDVGSVPGKALHCYCGEANCRRRLL